MIFDNLIMDPFNIPKEIEEGSYIEYKRHIKNLSTNMLEKRSTQMLRRLHEGYVINDKMMCTYLLGINDDGSIFGLDKKTRNQSVKNLKKMMNICGAHVSSFFIRKIRGRYIVQVNIISENVPEEFVF